MPRSSPSLRPWRFAAAAVASALALTGCNGSAGADTGSRTASDAQIPSLSWGLTSGPRSLDPAHAFDGASAAVNVELLEPLVGIDPRGKLESRLAASWSAPDPTTLVYDLRPGVTFWDGHPVTPADVVFSIEHHLDPATASQLAGYYSHIKSVTASGPMQVTITLKAPDPALRYTIAYALIMEKDYALAHAGHLGDPTGLIMGTGPFRVDSFSSATGATLIRNDHYWAAEPKVQRLQFKVITDPETLRLALQSGDVAGTFQVPMESARAWDKLSNVAVQYVDDPTSVILSLNTTQAPFSDVHVRRALAYALDRKGIVQSLFNGHSRTANSVIDPDLWTNLEPADKVQSLNSSLPQLGFDLGKAKAELARSSVPGGFSVTVDYPDARSYLGQILQTLAQNAKQLGIDITVKQVTSDQWLADLFGHKGSPMQIVPLGADYPDAAALPMVILGRAAAKPNGENFAEYTPANLEDPLATLRTGNTDERAAAMEQISKQLSEDLPYIPVLFKDSTLALDTKYVYDGTYSHWTNFTEEWAGHLRAAG